MEPTTSNIPFEKWPHPDDRLKVSEAAALIGVHVTTLGKAIRAIREGEVPNVKNRETLEVARVYAASPLGRADKVCARDLMSAVGVDPTPHETKLPRKTPARRLRIGKKEVVRWGKASAKELVEELRKAWGAMEALNTRNARLRVLEIGAVMGAKGICAEDWWMDPSKVILFSGSFGAWLETAKVGELWPFLLVGPHRRPVNLLTGRVGHENAVLSMMDPVMYARALADSCSVESSAAEVILLGTGARPGKAANKGRRRMSSAPTPSEDQDLTG